MNGATQVLFEGVPTYPDAGRAWDIVDKYKVRWHAHPRPGLCTSGPGTLSLHWSGVTTASLVQSASAQHLFGQDCSRDHVQL